MKYDKVVEMNQKIGKQNARIVEKEIERMIENGERVTVAALQRYTGFSNSFFYKNKLVREILYEAIRKQNQCYKNNYVSNLIRSVNLHSAASLCCYSLHVPAAVLPTHVLCVYCTKILYKLQLQALEFFY